MGGHGKQIKIRLLKKPRGPEPGVDASLSNVGGVETPVRALNSVQVPGVAGRNMHKWPPLFLGTADVPRSHVERGIPRPSLNVQIGPTVSKRIDVQGPWFGG
ncbi:hypothetical protein Tco_0071973 [Tanacetum coccineum]